MCLLLSQIKVKETVLKQATWKHRMFVSSPSCFNTEHFLAFLFSIFTNYARCVGTVMLLQYVQQQFISCCMVHHQGGMDIGHHLNLHVLQCYHLYCEAAEVFVIGCHLCLVGVSVQTVVYVFVSFLFILSNLWLIYAQFMLACTILTSQWHKPNDSSFRFIFIDRS